MRQRIYQLVANPLISGSALIFIGSFVGNICNFLFNFYMSRNLSVADYGVLASLVSLVVLAGMPAGAVLPTVVKFAAEYFAKNEIGKIKGLYFKVGKIMLVLGAVFFIIFSIFAREIAGFFHINNPELVTIAGLVVMISFVGTVNGAFLQGKLLFGFITFINFLGAFLKLLLGILLVFLGFRLVGAMWGFALSYAIPFILAIYPLRFIFQKRTIASQVHVRDLFAFGAPAAITLFCLTSFISTDIMLVKHFFTPDEAGKYAVLSLIGRIIFFLTASISTVMFPMVIQKVTRKEKYVHIFLLSLLLVSLPSIILTICYFTFPEFAISIFNKNKSYLELSGYLGIFGVFISLYSVLYVITNFFLSINKTKVFIPIALGALAQAALIWLFHDSFMQIIIISLTIVGLLLVVLLLYYLSTNRGSTKNKS
jgi:O-antigen/teichoic acid export membrane protein